MTKLEIARRQLGTATALYLDRKDSVSVHCLAAGGWEITQQLALDQGKKIFRDYVKEDNKEMTDALYQKIKNQFWNAYKHATKQDGNPRDDSELLSHVTLRETEDRLFGGWHDYLKLTGALPLEARIYSQWYLARDINKFADDVDPQIKERFVRTYPNLPNLPPARQHQLLLRAIAKAKRSRAMLTSNQTEHRPLILPD